MLKPHPLETFGSLRALRLDTHVLVVVEVAEDTTDAAIDILAGWWREHYTHHPVFISRGDADLTALDDRDLAQLGLQRRAKDEEL